MVIWPKCGNSSTSMREVTITSILQGCDQENHFFYGLSSLKFDNLTLRPRMPHTNGFLECLSFSHFLATSYCFIEKRFYWQSFCIRKWERIKRWRKDPASRLLADFRPVCLTLRPGMPHICSFLDCFSSSHFLATFCCL